MKKLLNPLVVSAFILVLMFGTLAHLMYGGCQTSKWHYIAQKYWIPKNMPKWMWESDRNMYEKFTIDDDYTGVWRDWYENGIISSRSVYLNGTYHGAHEMWFENGNTNFKVNYSNGVQFGKSQMWHENGIKNMEVVWGKTKQLSMSEWDIKGKFIFMSKYDKKSKQYTSTYFKEDLIIKKEYFDINDDFLKRELFEKGKVVKVEFKEFP
ncbi:MAG: hypothetical protein COA79_22325 [Planctomycetota bacterium]|nr:MAG: hypothetical protein COA79_22325 [Planctomycetota bacterium]